MPPGERSKPETMLPVGPHDLYHGAANGGAGEWMEEELGFQYLQQEVKTPSRNEKRREPWISEATWCLEDQRTDLIWLRQGHHCGHCIDNRRFKSSLQADRRRQISIEGGELSPYYK